MASDRDAIPPSSTLQDDQDTTSDSQDEEEEDGFFSLDLDLDINSMDKNQKEKARTNKSPPRRKGGTSLSKDQSSETTSHPSPSSFQSSSSIYASSFSPQSQQLQRSISSNSTSSLSPPPIQPLAPEPDRRGNLEYKLWLLPPTRDRFNKLLTQAKWRMLQGGGIAVYEIGVLDDGTLVGLNRWEMRDSLNCLNAMAKELKGRVEISRVIEVEIQSEVEVELGDQKGK